jgi:predicted nucleic acid-binding protein
MLLDAGPLVAYLDPSDHFHSWARDCLKEIEIPLLTCEAVITEACFLLHASRVLPHALLEIMENGLIRASFHLQEEVPVIARLMKRYADLPMSLADACLVRMAEQHSNSRILTIDRHFKIYRKNGREVIPTLMPPA